MYPSSSKTIERRTLGTDQWLGFVGEQPEVSTERSFNYTVLDSEIEVGRSMLDELLAYAKEKNGDIVFVLLGGRGAQAMYRLIAEKAVTAEIDHLLSRLHIFTQD